MALIPEVLERLQIDLEIGVEDEILYGKLSDKVNDAYGFVYAMAQLVGPIIGSALYEAMGQRKTMDWTTVMLIVYSLILFFFNCGPRFIAEHRCFLKALSNWNGEDAPPEEDWDVDDELDEADEADENDKALEKIKTGSSHGKGNAKKGKTITSINTDE